jgi:hypothetical protein
MFFLINSDNLGVNGITVSEMAEKTGLKPKTILNRLRTLGIKPITKEALYDPAALSALEAMPPVGRPAKKAKAPAP